MTGKITGNGGREVMPIITKDTYMKLPIEDIEIIEQRNGKIKITTKEGSVFRVSGKISDIAELLGGKCFYRVMKSVIVNFNRVESMGNCIIHFESGNAFGVGKNNFMKARRAFKNYLYGYPPFLRADAYNRETHLMVAEKTELDEFEQDDNDS